MSSWDNIWGSLLFGTGKRSGHMGKLQSTEGKIYEMLCLSVHSWVMKIIKGENDRLFQPLHQPCSEKPSQQWSAASAPSTALLMWSLPAPWVLWAHGGLEGATGWEETEVIISTQLLPGTGTPTEMTAGSMEADEGFHADENVMLKRRRKLKIDGKDCSGTSAPEQN